MQPETWKAWALFLAGVVAGHAGWDAAIVFVGGAMWGFIVGVQPTDDDEKNEST